MIPLIKYIKSLKNTIVKMLDSQLYDSIYSHCDEIFGVINTNYKYNSVNVLTEIYDDIELMIAIMKIEEIYDIIISDEDIKNMKTNVDYVKYIYRKIEGR
jgi:acyl carrier protein